MKIKILGMIAAMLVFAACSKQEDAKNDAVEAEIPVVKVADFESQAENFVNKKVLIEGTVVHVCAHSGKRVFIVDGSDDARVKIEAEDNSPGFKMELIGSKVAFEGIIEEDRLSKAEIEERELEVQNDIKAQKELGGENCEIDGSSQEKLEHYNSLKAEMEKSGKAYVSFFSVRCSSYKEVTSQSKS